MGEFIVKIPFNNDYLKNDLKWSVSHAKKNINIKTYKENVWKFFLFFSILFFIFY